MNKLKGMLKEVAKEIKRLDEEIIRDALAYTKAYDNLSKALAKRFISDLSIKEASQLIQEWDSFLKKYLLDRELFFDVYNRIKKDFLYFKHAVKDEIKYLDFLLEKAYIREDFREEVRERILKEIIKKED